MRLLRAGRLASGILRQIGDVDLIVTTELWESLAKQFGVTETEKVRKIEFPNDDIEAFWEGSFYLESPDPEIPSIAERIAQAEIIEDLPFESLENTLLFKRKMGREKDLRDIAMLEAWLRK